MFQNNNFYKNIWKIYDEKFYTSILVHHGYECHRSLDVRLRHGALLMLDATEFKDVSTLYPV